MSPTSYARIVFIVRIKSFLVPGKACSPCAVVRRRADHSRFVVEKLLTFNAKEIKNRTLFIKVRLKILKEKKIEKIYRNKIELEIERETGARA